MSTTYFDSETSVRRRGEVVMISSHDHDGCRNTITTGTRRDRQIGKRHWVRREERWWSSGGGGKWSVTVQTPEKSVGVLEKQYWH